MFFFFLLLFFSLAGSPLWIFFLFLLPWSVLFFLSFSGSLEKSPSLIRSGSLPPPLSFFCLFFLLPPYFLSSFFFFSGSPYLSFFPFFFKRTHPLSFFFSFWFLPFPATTVFFGSSITFSSLEFSPLFVSFFFLFIFFFSETKLIIYKRKENKKNKKIIIIIIIITEEIQKKRNSEFKTWRRRSASLSLASISSTVQRLFGSRGRSRSHRGSLGGEEEEDVALSLAGNSSAIPATFSDSFHYSTPYRLFHFFFSCFFLCFSPHTSHCLPPTPLFFTACLPSSP